MNYQELMKYTKDLTVLYAEDDEMTAKVIEFFLKNIFKNVTLVLNGIEAIKKFQEKKYDLILLDIEMPLMNGLEVAEEIKKVNINQKIIFFTAFDEINYLKTALDIKADDYIFKPLDEEEFVEKIYKVVKK